ncbi:phosphate transporter family domain-containing protein [Ditylenchus destructor]|nr:phosphate transporter family domain-containing protein [Ditylenchus destructor]
MVLHMLNLAVLGAATTTIAPDVIGDFQHSILWGLIIGAILAFVLGFGMGANDVSNAFGTSVGSKVLTMKQAYILATIFETLGAVLVGYNVTDTMRKGVVDIEVYASEPKTLFLGQIAILGGCSAWLMIATFAELPVSTTQSVVGATVGFSMVCRGFAGIQWSEILRIVISWFASPLFSGTISGLLYILLDIVVLRRKHPLENGLRALPYFYFACIAFNTFAVSYQGSKILHLASVPLWLAFVLSFVIGLVAALLVHFVMRPRLESWIHRRHTVASIRGSMKRSGTVLKHSVAPTDDIEGSYVIEKSKENGKDSAIENGIVQEKKEVIIDHQELPNTEEDACETYVPQPLEWTVRGFFSWLLPARERKEDPKTLKLFSSIQVFTACFAGFGHGANDVSNAIAPLTALLAIYQEMSVRQESPTPIYVLLYGVLAICIGLCILGHKVIKTVGQRMSDIHPASGFTIEFGAAVTALCASKIGLPISTTHCLVGSVVSVGCVKAGEGIRWSIFRNIVFSWLVTLPVSALIAAGIMLLLKLFV